MPSQTPTHQHIAPVPRRHSPLLTSTLLGSENTHYFTTTLSSKTQDPYTFVTRFQEHDYHPPAPPPPSPVNFSGESWRSESGSEQGFKN